MKKPVIYVVRAVPIINDATYEDAVDAGIDKVANIKRHIVVVTT